MTSNADAIRQLFGPPLGGIDLGGTNLAALEAIYPDYDAPVVTAYQDVAKLETMCWGWPPFGEVKRPITNVRNLQSPMWRAALRDPKQRCLVPVTAFCEYGAAPDTVTRRKRQHWFALKSAQPFAFAGIWRPTGDGPRFAFLTCEPNALVGVVHPKAMPVMLAEDDLGRWLRDDWSAAQTMVRPFDPSLMCELDVTAPQITPPDDSTSQPSLFG